MKIDRKALVISGFVVLAVSMCFVNTVRASTYYVDSAGGLDSNSGTSSSTAWQTIAKVNSLACGSGAGQLNAGDSVLFKDGQTWREQLSVPCSGSSGSPITFSTYGSGAAPQILSSITKNTTSSWSPYPAPFNFYDGFETGDLKPWTASATGAGAVMTVASDSAKYGAYSLKIVNTAAAGSTDIQKNLASALNPIYSTFFFKSSAPSFSSGGEMNLAVGFSSSSANQWKFFLYYNGMHYYFYMQQYTNAGSSYLPGFQGSGWQADSVMDGSWHRIDIFSFGAAGTGAANFSVDGVQRGSLTSLTNDTKGFSQNIQYGTKATSGTSTGSFYLDDVYINNVAYPTTTNLWYANSSISPGALWRDNVQLLNVTSTGVLNATNQYYWDGISKIVAWTSDATNPATSGGAHDFEFSANDHGVGVTGESYITINGLATDYAGTVGIFYSSGANNGTIQNSTVSYSGSNNIAFNASNNFNINGNTLSYAGQNGIQIQNSSNGSVYSNDVSHAGVASDDRSAISVWLDSANNLVYKNHAHDNASGGSAGIRGIIIDTVQGNGTNYVYDNLTDHNDGGGIDIYESNGQQVYYNISYDNTTAGSSTPAGIKVAGSVNANVFNNVVYNNSYAGILGYTSSLDNLPTTGAAVKNNIVLMLPSGNHYGIVFDNTSNTADYNLVYGANNSTDWLYDWPIGTFYTSAASLYAGTGQGQHDINLNPLVISTSSLNFMLQSSSPAINAGVNVNLISDYAGTQVPTIRPPDMGAYEYTQTTTPFIAITNPVASSTATNTVTVIASTTAAAPASPYSVQFLLDGTSLGSAIMSAPYQFSWNTTLSANGVHALSALFTDTYNNTSSAPTVSITVQNSTAPVAAPISVGSASYNVHVNGGDNATENPEVVLSLYGTAAYTMEVSNRPDFIGSNPMPYQTSLAWTLDSQPGMKTVYVRFISISKTILGQAEASITLEGNTTTSPNQVSASTSVQALGTLPASNEDIPQNHFMFTRDLSLGKSGSDVTQLQLLLIAQAAGPAAARLAAHGVTSFFGVLTQNALAEFQKKAGIFPTAGYLGPKTRAYVSRLP